MTLRQIQGELLSRGVRPVQICAIDMQDLAFDSIVGYRELGVQVETHLTDLDPSSRKYLFFDEIQDIAEWERAIRHFAKKIALKFLLPVQTQRCSRQSYRRIWLGVMSTLMYIL